MSSDYSGGEREKESERARRGARVIEVSDATDLGIGGSDFGAAAPREE